MDKPIDQERKRLYERAIADCPDDFYSGAPVGQGAWYNESHVISNKQDAEVKKKTDAWDDHIALIDEMIVDEMEPMQADLFAVEESFNPNAKAKAKKKGDE